MKEFIIDAKTGAVALDRPAAVRNQMSWRRLADALIAGGHVGPRETLTHFIVSQDSIKLCFTYKDTGE